MKKIFLVVLAIFAVLVLSGCYSDPNNGTAADISSGRTVTLTLGGADFIKVTMEGESKIYNVDKSAAKIFENRMYWISTDGTQKSLQDVVRVPGQPPLVGTWDIGKDSKGRMVLYVRALSPASTTK